jgi:paraquat-inducible protein B
MLLSDEESLAQMERLVERGLRVQLKTGNLLTGQLFVDLDFYPDAEKAMIDKSGQYPVMPTIPTSIAEIKKSVVAVMEKLENFPLDQLGKDFTATLGKLNKTIGEAEATLKT